MAILSLLKGGLDLIAARVGGIIVASACSDDRGYVALNDVFFGFPIRLSRLKGTGPKLNSGLVGANQVAIIIDTNLVGVVAGFVLAAGLLVAFGAPNFGHTQAIRAHFTNVAFGDDITGFMTFTIGAAEKAARAIGALGVGGCVFTSDAGESDAKA